MYLKYLSLDLQQSIIKNNQSVTKDSLTKYYHNYFRYLAIFSSMKSQLRWILIWVTLLSGHHSTTESFLINILDLYRYKEIKLLRICYFLFIFIYHYYVAAWINLFFFILFLYLNEDLVFVTLKLQRNQFRKTTFGNLLNLHHIFIKLTKHNRKFKILLVFEFMVQQNFKILKNFQFWFSIFP